MKQKRKKSQTYEVAFNVWSKNLAPSDLTAIFGIKPTNSKDSRKKISKITWWQLRSPYNNNWSLEKNFSYLVAKIEKNYLLKKLPKNADCDVTVNVYFRDANCNFQLPGNIQKWNIKHGVPLFITTYPTSD